jgi:hypothetical protein
VNQNKIELTLNSLTRTNLELPLSWHDFGIGSRDLDSSVQASLEVRLDNISAINLARTDTTIVRTLGAGETSNWPTIRSVRHIKEGILLLQTEPGFVLLVSLHELVGLIAVVELVGRSVGIPAFTDHQDIWSLAERIGEDRDGSEVDIGVVAGCLAGGATVEVPLGEIFESEFTALGHRDEGL